jgi:hypothetical protein
MQSIDIRYVLREDRKAAPENPDTTPLWLVHGLRIECRRGMVIVYGNH